MGCRQPDGFSATTPRSGRRARTRTQRRPQQRHALDAHCSTCGQRLRSGTERHGHQRGGWGAAGRGPTQTRSARAIVTCWPSPRCALRSEPPPCSREPRHLSDWSRAHQNAWPRSLDLPSLMLRSLWCAALVSDLACARRGALSMAPRMQPASHATGKGTGRPAQRQRSASSNRVCQPHSSEAAGPHAARGHWAAAAAEQRRRPSVAFASTTRFIADRAERIHRPRPRPHAHAGDQESAESDDRLRSVHWAPQRQTLATEQQRRLAKATDVYALAGSLFGPFAFPCHAAESERARRVTQ